MKRVLFVGTDVAGFNEWSKIVSAGIPVNVSIVYMLEKGARKAAEGAGITPSYVGPTDAKQYWYLDPISVIMAEDPDVVVTDLPHPYGIAQRAAAAAKQAGKKLIVIADSLGAHVRLEDRTAEKRPRPFVTVPDLVLCASKATFKMASDDSRFADAKKVYVGSHNVAVKPAQHEIDLINRLRLEYRLVLVLATQKCPESEDILRFGLESAERAHRVSPEYKLALIPRIHPGAASDLKETWRAMIDEFDARHPGVINWAPETDTQKFNTSALIAMADGVIVAGGNGPEVAANARQIPFLVSTERLGAWLEGEMGMMIHPYVELGVGVKLDSPINIAGLFIREADKIRARQREIVNDTPPNYELAAREVANLLPA